MCDDTIKFQIKQNPVTKSVKLEIYRPYGIDNEWMRIDVTNELSIEELRHLTKYLIGLFSKNKK